jgi:hypothetical protein
MRVVGGGFEQVISRILSLCSLAAAQVAIIYLGRPCKPQTLEVTRPEKRAHPVSLATSGPL